jgi:hypothetical protein
VDEKLKADLTEKIKAAQEDLKDPRIVKVLLENKGRQTSLKGDEKRPENALFERVQKKLLKARLWKPVERVLTQQGFALFLRNLERTQTEKAAKVEISAARAQQLDLFPGLENLPTRIRVGPGYIVFVGLNLAQFLNYEGEYQAKAAKDQRRAGELHEIAEKVRVYVATNPEMPLTEAFARAEAQAAKFRAVIKLG